GTHVYTALKFAPGDTKTRWLTVDVGGFEQATNPLDRIEVPDDLRQRISQRLTPGSTLILADTSINSANLPKGGDFVVLAKGTGEKIAEDDAAKPKPKRRVARRSYDDGDDIFSGRSRNGFFFNRGGWAGRPW